MLNHVGRPQLRLAVRDGDALIAQTVARLHASRDRLVRALAAIPGVEVAPPPGAMYLFFRIVGRSGDSFAFAKRLVAEAGLGIAPGVAFGPEGEGYLRWCFAAGAVSLDPRARRSRVKKGAPIDASRRLETRRIPA